MRRRKCPARQIYSRNPTTQPLSPTLPCSSFYLLSQLPRYIRQPATQPAIHSPRLRINIACLITRQKQDRARNLIRLPPSPQWIQLSNLLLTAPFPRRIVRNLRHARLNQSRTNGVASDACTDELVRACLHERNHGGFAGAVVCGSGVGAQTCDRCSRDDRAARIWFRSGCLEHGARGVFGGEEDGEGVCFEHLHEVVGRFFPEDEAAGYAGVGEEDVEAPVLFDGLGDDSLDSGFFGGIEGAGVNVYAGVEAGELARVQVEVGRGEVAEVDCFGAVARELVRGGAANAYGGVCACGELGRASWKE
jgi:hypothetical protein